MTQVLPSGMEAKTGYAPEILLRGLDRPERHFVELGENVFPFVGMDGEPPSTKMIDAVFALRDAFNNPPFADDPEFIRFKELLSTFEIKVVRWSRSSQGKEDIPVIRFVAETDFYWNLDTEDPDETVEVLGHELTRNDLMSFISYLMTNTEPEGPGDPRISFIETVKEDLKK